MRIVVDASAALNQGAGIGRYARVIIPAMANELPEFEVRAFVARDEKADPDVEALGKETFEAAGIEIRNLPFSRRQADIAWFRGRVPLPIELFAGKNGVVYSPDFTAPPSISRRSIVTVHDLAFEVAPEYSPAGLREYLRNTVPRQVKKAARVAVVSETTRRDLIERYGVPSEKIGLVSNGVSDRFFDPPALSDEDHIRLGIPSEYLLMVGTLEPRKNHLSVFEALEQSEVAREIPLVVSGRRGWNDDEIVDRIASLQDRGKVKWISYAPERLLPSLFSGAMATIYPSWYEGFGLPALESLAAGTPLVISRAPSLIEVARGVAREADAGRPDQIAEAIDLAVTQDRTPERKAARQERARHYRWERSGAAAAQLVRDALS
ncbi:glycosyltransferase family 1 protein [soil metagenome]